MTGRRKLRRDIPFRNGSRFPVPLRPAHRLLLRQGFETRGPRTDVDSSPARRRHPRHGRDPCRPDQGSESAGFERDEVTERDAPRKVQTVFRRLKEQVQSQKNRWKGSVFVEYILLVTIVGIGVIVGLACIRQALVNELIDLANAINSINC